MELLYEVWLHTLSDFEPETAAKAAPFFDRKTTSFASGDVEARLMEDIGLSGEFSKRIAQPEFFKQAKDIIDYCKRNDIRIITQESREYPDILKEINLPPRLLFAKGAPLKKSDYIGVAVVGCRKPTDHGKSFARLVGQDLGKNNITVISGMAEGIDGQAHMGALDAGGRTIAVLAGSVDVIYPKCHEKLYRRILENGGTIISERPPGTPAKKYFYQQRNRIITGLSQGVVIVEGKLASGTSITARLALEENRDVFAVPNSPMLWQAELPNKLIAEGATIVNRENVPALYYKDIRPDLVIEKTEDLPQKNETKIKSVTDDERIIKYISDAGGVAGIEMLAEALDMGLNVLSARLTILCIKGKLRQESGNRYVLTKQIRKG